MIDERVYDMLLNSEMSAKLRKSLGEILKLSLTDKEGILKEIIVEDLHFRICTSLERLDDDGYPDYGMLGIRLSGYIEKEDYVYPIKVNVLLDREFK